MSRVTEQAASLHQEHHMSLYGTRQLADSIRVVRSNTVRIAEDIPESRYEFRPTPESRSVAELLVHIAWLSSADRFMHEEQHIDAIEQVDFGALLDESDREEKRGRTKAEIVELLRTEGERWARWIEELPEAFFAETVRMPDGRSANRFEMLLGTKEHEMHHRGQLTAIERMLDVVPHFTRNRQVVRRMPEPSAREAAIH